MRKKRPTSHQVAKRAGVSRSTVSFILNDVPGMKFTEETRERVLQAALELGYVPDAAARTLASGQTRTVGLVIFSPEHLRVDAFIPQVLYSLHAVCREAGFRVIVETVEDVRQPDAYLSLVRAKQIDGLVVLNTRSDDEQLPRLIGEGFPVVTLGRVGHPGEHSVNHRAGTRLLMGHLIGLGYTRIAHITYAPLQYRSSDRRLADYRRALERAGIGYDPALVRHGNYSAESGFEAMRSLLEERPRAVFCGNDTIAFGALAALREAGLRVPEDVAVVGYDDIPTAAYAAPPLTTIHTPALEQGRLAGEMLIQLVRGETPPEPQIILPSKLVVRCSCGAPEAARATPNRTAQRTRGT